MNFLANIDLRSILILVLIAVAVIGGVKKLFKLVVAALVIALALYLYIYLF